MGTGGGLPGMINAIMYPDHEFVLLDATLKKINVLNDMIDSMGLKNVRTAWGRAEELGFKADYKNRFDMCTSRGLAELRKLITWSLPFLKPDGIILAMKGGDLTHEVQGIKKRSRYTITEFEAHSKFHGIERFKTLKLVEISRASDDHPKTL